MLEAVNISFASLNIQTLYPMLIAISGALFILCIDLIKSGLNKSMYVMIALLFLALDLGAVLDFIGVFETTGAVRGFFDVMLMDGLAILAQIIMIVASMLFILLALTKQRFNEYRYPEYFALFLFMIAGLQFMVASDNLILVFVGLETSSLALYPMIAMHNRRNSFEAAAKYFTMGALAAGFFAFGAMILYALTGSVEIGVMAASLAATGIDTSSMIFIIIATVFLLAAFAFKLGLVPFHTWTPDVYQGSTAALAGFMSIVPKLAAFVVAIRLFEFLMSTGVLWIEIMLYAIVVLTMTMSNIWALVQKDVKRMLGYSSISHAGFVMAAVLIGTTHANTALFLYWALFAFANLGAFAMLWMTHEKVHDRVSDDAFEKFSGMIKTSPFAAVMMALFMLSLAGIPPFALFWGKLYLISSAVTGGYIVLALIMALNSAVAAYYYVKIIVYMFMKEPVGTNDYTVNSSTVLKTVIGTAALFAIASVLAVSPLMEFVARMVYNSGY
ncbi:MAG: NADH-quinone oxidoreductase subunit NuoN [Campylobacterales bacterium]|nr:NADH-quinone oxidoreductase subunit NuoN [Campylobacterales bacterium]